MGLGKDQTHGISYSCWQFISKICEEENKRKKLTPGQERSGSWHWPLLCGPGHRELGHIGEKAPAACSNQGLQRSRSSYNTLGSKSTLRFTAPFSRVFICLVNTARVLNPCLYLSSFPLSRAPWRYQRTVASGDTPPTRLAHSQALFPPDFLVGSTT